MGWLGIAAAVSASVGSKEQRPRPRQRLGSAPELGA